jgi:ribonuclease G
MSKELVISASRHEIKVAILEDDQLVEIYFQRSNEYSLAGSIHKGRVTRVLPGMQSAFVDLGLERDTFLYVSDFFEENDEYDRIGGKDEREVRPERSPRSAEPRGERPFEAIPATVAAGQEVIPSTEAPPAAPALSERPLERSDESDGRDRRGRRSRRRRSRGRGFPDSKYAEARPPGPIAESQPAPEPERSPETSEPEFSVLPGESLAKYRHSGVEPLDDDEQEEIRTAHDEVNAPLSEEPEEAPPRRAMPEDVVDTVPVTPIREEPAEPQGLPQREFDTLGDREPRTEEIEVASAADLPEDDSMEAELAEAVAVANAELIAEADVEAEAEHASAAEFENPESAGSRNEGREAPAPQLSANVREQGGRYMHRMPRRMRRKMRSAGQSEGRAEERRSETGPAGAGTEAAAVARPEQRTISRPAEKPAGSTPSITDLLKEGQEIIVQIAKEPLGQKGARITSHIALPGRYVVYMPTLEHIGVSRKIASDEERQRLKRILQTHRAGVTGGLIIRTAGEGKSEEDIASDINFLFNLWTDIRQKAEKKPAPVLLHHDLDIVQRTLRDQFTETFKAIWVDNEEYYENVLSFVQRFQPALVSRVKLYTRPAPIFDAFNITSELEKALRPKVWLKSGGYIVINQTEALVAIDVNTGKYVGKSNRLEDTIVKTNTEAVKEIVRQIRLRDLGGIIVVDFIDMDERKNRQKVMQTLEEAMRADRAPNKILQFNDFGLVAITRKRVKQSLERALCAPCTYCDGAGYVKSVQTVVGEILQEAHKLAPAVADQKDVVLRVHPEVAKILKSHHNKYLEELEEILRRPVLVKGDLTVHQEKFDLA